jgi:hypothetical protein
MHIKANSNTFHLGIELQRIRIVKFGRIGYMRCWTDANVLFLLTKMLIIKVDKDLSDFINLLLY